MEQVFPYELRIENRLATPIAYCEAFEASICPHVIPSGRINRQIFMSHVADGSDEKRMEAFDRLKIRVCEKLIDFKAIRSVVPVVKRDKNHFEIVINDALSRKFCQ